MIGMHKSGLISRLDHIISSGGKTLVPLQNLVAVNQKISSMI